MSLGKRFNSPRGLLTGVALENNDALGAGLPPEEEPAVVEPEAAVVPEAGAAPVTDVPAGDAGDVPAAPEAPAADPLAEPAAEAPVDGAVPAAEVPAAEPAPEPAPDAGLPAADLAAPVAEAPAAELPVESPAAELPPLEDVPAADAPVVDAPAADAVPEAVAAPVEPVVDADPATAEAPPAVPADAAAAPVAAADVAEGSDPIQMDAGEDLAAADAQIATDDVGFDESLSDTAEVANQIDNGAQDVETINSIADSLESTLDEGGAPASTIEVANIAVEAMIARLNGGHKPQRMLPALEAFGGLRNRVRSTELAIESLRGAASEAGNKIMQFIHKCIAFLKSLLQKFTDGFTGMKQKLAALAAAAKQGQLAQGAVRINQTVVSRLKLGGKFGKQQFVKGMAAVESFLDKVANLLGVAAKTTSSVDLAAAGGDGGFPEINADALGAAVKAFGGKVQETEEGVVNVTNLELLPGDATAHIGGPGVHVIGDQAYRAVSSVDVNISGVASENDTFAEVDEAVTEAEFAQMNKVLARAVAKAEAFRAVTNAVMQAQATVVKGVQGAATAGGRGLSMAQNFASRVANSLTRSVSKTIAWVRGVLNAGLQYLASFVQAAGAAGQAAGTAVANTAKRGVDMAAGAASNAAAAVKSAVKPAAAAA